MTINDSYCYHHSRNKGNKLSKNNAHKTFNLKHALTTDFSFISINFPSFRKEDDVGEDVSEGVD